MTTIIDGTAGITFPDTSVQAVTATNASNLSTGTVPKARMYAGAMLQVVSTTLSSSQSTSSTSFVASTLIATITPSSSSSKILVLLNGGTKDSNSTNNGISTYLYRNIASAGYSSLTAMESFNFASSNPAGGHSFNYLDSPATTSSISYQPYFKVSAGTGSVWFLSSGGVVSLTLMEISA